MTRVSIVVVLCLLAACSAASPASSAGDAGSSAVDASTRDGSPVDPSGRYDIGAPVLTDLWVSPSGHDDHAGTSRDSPLRTLSAAWARVPEVLDAGHRINLLPGDYPCGDDELVDCNNVFSGRRGTYEHPLVIQSVDASGAPARGTAVIRGGLDLYDVHHLYLFGVTLVAGPRALGLPTNASGNNVLHVAASDHVLIRGITARGPDATNDTESNIQEVFKANQVAHLFLEDSELSGTFQTVIDWFSVQHGHVLGNRAHRAGGRCAYLKGGSAYIVVAGNELSNCHEAGFQAGEGSMLTLMVPPFIHYEVYDLKVVNNVIHDIWGAGLTVAGGYDVLFAYNTLYRVGLSDGRAWGLVQLLRGGRVCIPSDEYPSLEAASERCRELVALGAFGMSVAGNYGDSGGEWVPNANVFVYDNLFYNPPGTSTELFHFAVDGPLALPPEAENIPDPSPTDTNLQIRGNLVFDGPATHTMLGSTNGSDPGCTSANPTCDEAELRRDNVFTETEPELVDPENGDYRPRAGAELLDLEALPIPDFPWGPWPAGSVVPEGTRSNEVTTDFTGHIRARAHPGAFTTD